MAYNANTEDYQRLALRYVTSAKVGPAEAMAGFADFWRNVSSERHAQLQTDADRAFHLVALATNVVDYQLPFAPESQADALLNRGRALLDEALSLDPDCHDARRMRACMDLPSFDERYGLLVEGKDRVFANCSVEADTLGSLDEERTELAKHLAMAPYLRWLAALADHALVCGHNHSCVNYCHELLKLDPADNSDVRYTLALCLAKLEDRDALDRIGELIDPSFRPVTWDDAWSLISRMAIAYKAHDLREARHHLSTLLSLYPNANKLLIRQSELPDGLFARIRTFPFSEDELLIALSEATVLTQEGAEEYGQGPFGMWIVDEVVRADRLGPGGLGPGNPRGIGMGKRGGAQ